MARALGSDRPPSELHRLTGGLEAMTYAFRLREDRFVVKVFVDGPDLAQPEFDNLVAVSGAGVPTPVPVLIDGDGAWFGAPAVVMTALPGRPEMHPADRSLWIDEAATALAAVHGIPAARARHVRPSRWQRWQPSTEGMGSDAASADAMLARLYQQVGTLPTVLSHDDFNPGNLLFEGGRLTGVVDWADISVEPRHAAVALFRHFLAIHPEGEAPDLFVDAYELATGCRLRDLPLWDVLYGLRGVRKVDHWAMAFTDLGLDITSAEIQDRSRSWVRTAIAVAGG